MFAAGKAEQSPGILRLEAGSFGQGAMPSEALSDWKDADSQVRHSYQTGPDWCARVEYSF